MPKVAVDVNKEKQTPKTNKEIIQNINRTGTVSGEKSGVSNISSSKIVNTNTNTFNLAGNNQSQALGTPNKTPSVTVGGRDITKQVEQQKKNEALNVPKSNPVIDKVKSAVNNIFQMAGEETGRMKLKNDYTAQRMQNKLDSVNAENMDLANSTTPEMYQQMFTPNGQRRDNSNTINGIKNEMAQLDTKIAAIGNDDMAIQEISRRNELQEQLNAFDDLDKRANAIEELSTQNWLKENGDEEGLARYQEQLSHKNDTMWERGANALNHLGNTTANIIPTAFDQMKELGSNKMAMDSIETLEQMHNSGEIDDSTYLESLAEWQDFIDVHKSTNSDNLSQIIRTNADRLSANTYYGASDIEKFCLQAGESTAQFLLHFALLGEAATVSMSLASGTDKMNQLLMEGVDPQTAAQNGLMTGLVSYATEKVGMDRFVDMMGTPFSADALGSIIINQLKSGLSEGLEEVVEGLIDPVIDSVTLGTPYEVNGDELKMEFLLGGASGLAMAVGGTVLGTVQEAQGVNAYLNERRSVREAVQNQIGELVVKTQYQKNLLVDEINMLKKHYDTMTESQKEVAREVIAKGENAVRNFEQMSQVPGVAFSTDIPQTTSTEENDRTIYQTYTPDFNTEVRYEQKINETESVIDDLMKNQIAVDEMNNQTQQILNENGYDLDAKVFNSIDEKQQEQTLLAHDFAKALGYDVDIVNNLGENIHGKRSKSTGRITIDASMGKNPVLQTLAHEITHGTENGSRYKELRDLVKTNFTEDQWNAEVKRIQDIYKKNADQDLAPEEAEKEIVAKYVEHNLNDEQFIEDLIKYNFSLASRIKQNMKSFFSSDENQQFKTTYERVFKNARDEMIDKTLQAIKDGFEGMIGENYVSKDDLQMSVAQWDVTGREILKRYLTDPENDISEETKNAILDRMEEVYKAMKEFEETGKYPQFSQWQDTFYSINDRGDLSVVINNGDYELNIDFSTVCKKRKMMDKVINALTKNGYLTRALKNTDIAKIREIIDKHGFEVACGLCFVDTKRFNQGSWAGRFETKWNGLIDQLSGALDIDDSEVNTFNFQAGLTDASPSLQNIDFSNPKLASFVALSEGGSEEAKMARALINNPDLRAKVSTNDMYGSSGFEALQKANPTLFKLVNASGGSSKPKLAHTEVTYFNEIINSPKFNPEEAKKVGGVRLQSFSDFMTNMVFDYVQMFSDMEAKKLTGHSYTKVKEYALLFGKTGMKINLSLIPAGFDSKVYTAEQIAKMGKKSKEFLKLKENAGLDANGNYMFDKESFDFDLAVEIQNLDGYDKNVGTICVGVSDKHILKLLSDDRICMVIPYHRSGISPLVADKMGISTFNDYTNKQNTRFKKPNGKPGKKVGKGFDFNFYEGSDANGKHFAGMIENNYDAKKTADSYKAWCEENEYIPKFGDNPEILNHPNYYKLLIDFRAYDKNGNVAPQESVKISGDSGIGTEYVPLDTKANPKLAKLYGDNIGFNNVLQKGLDVYEKTESDQNEAVDPISQEVIRELGLEKDQLSVSDETDTEYMSAVNNGDMETAQRMVDETAKKAGYDIKAYHSTNAEFTKFSKEKQGTNFNNYLHFGSGFYFGPTVDETKRYGKNTMSVYLSADRLLNVGKPVENEKAYQYLIDNGYHPGDARFVMNYGDRFINALYDTLLDKYSQGGANVQVQNLLREFGYDGIDAVYGVNNDKGQVVVFEPSQIKSADPVVYDDNGNIIPLSERFNSNNDDIRYSISDDTDSNGDALSKGQQKYFKNSKARDKNGKLLVLYHGTINAGFTRFNPGAIFMTTSKEDADSYGGNDFDRNGFAKGRLFEPGMQTEYETNVSTIGDILENPDAYSLDEVKRAFYSWDRDATLEDATKEEIIDVLNEYAEENEDIKDIRFESANGEPITANDNRATYKLYANLTNPYIADLGGKKAYDGSANLYDALRKAQAGGYDGLIARNTRIGRYEYNGDVVVAFSPEQVKLASNLNPTSDEDIQYSADELTVDEDSLPITKKTMTSKDMDKMKTAKILPNQREEKPRLNNVLDGAKTELKGKVVSRYAAIEELAEKTDNKKLVPLIDEVMRANAMADRAIFDGVVDKNTGKVIGKSLTDIMGKIPEQFRAAFDEYLYNWRNVDEMTMYERFAKNQLAEVNRQLKELKGETLTKEIKKRIRELNKQKKELSKIKNRPVFGESVTAEDSMDRIAELEELHPEFKDIAKEMWDLNRQYLKMRQESGIVSNDTYEDFIKKRPHYVPISRDIDNSLGASAVNPNDIKKFKGSSRDLKSVEDAMKKHIRKTYNVISMNDLNKEIIKTYGGGENVDSDELEDLMEEGYAPVEENPDGRQISAYVDGKKYSIPVNKEIYDSLAPKKTEESDLKKAADITIANVSKWRKALLTSKNPIFSLFTNPMRDIQDAFGQTKYRGKLGEKYAGYLVKAANEVRTNGEYSKMYDNLGISSGQYIYKDIADAYEKMNKSGKFKKFFNNLTEIGESIEKIPRLAEFMASLDAGNDVRQAALDAADVTTNFKRGGTFVKKLDKYGFPFLNASVQGFDKQLRNAKGDINKIRTEGVKGLLSVMVRLTLAAGLVPRALQDWLWKDDDDYKELSDYVKDRYYILPDFMDFYEEDGKKKFKLSGNHEDWKTEGGRFIRIPKGRVAAFLQTIADGGYKLAKKQKDVWDMLIDDWMSFADNVAPNSVADSFIGSPLIQAFGTENGRSWYGEDIVPKRLQDAPASEQYDESTDLLSIKLGELSRKIAKSTKNDKFELSPYKIHYVLDQYSGVFGDFVLPALTLKTAVGVNNPILKGAVSPLVDKFTTDPVLKNQNVSTAYDLLDKLKTRSKSAYAEDEEILSYNYLSSVASEMGKLYGKIHDIQGNPDLTNREKLDQVRTIQKEINELAKTGLANYDNIDIVGDYAQVGGVQYYKGESGWKKPSKSQLEKLGNADLSLEDRDSYFKTWSSISDEREKIKKNTPEGQTANYDDATINAINSSKLSAKGKNTLYDSYYDSKFTNHVNSMNLTDEEKYNLKVAGKLAKGTKDANGKTISNSKAQATADAYRELGLLEDVLNYIKDNDIAPSEMGLSKSVYNSLINGTSSSSSSRKKSSSGSKKSSTRKSTGGSVSNSVRKGGKLNKVSAAAPAKVTERKIANSFTRAYSNVLNRNNNRKTSSAGSNSVTCPRCGNRVSPGSRSCPVCGQKL